MGFDVTGQFVSINNSHNRYAYTSPCKENPFVKEIPKTGIYVIGIFKRTKGGKGTRIGDNCPMIYALKARDALQTNSENAKKLYRAAINIINGYISSTSKEWDLIIPIPSSSEISSRLANVIHKKNNKSWLENDLLGKVKVKNVHEQVEILKRKKEIHSNDAANINNAIKREGLNGDDYFPMKIIKTKLRHHLNPFQLLSHHHSVCNENLKILLVDDLVSTGTSICSAKNILLGIFPNASFEAMSLFSMLDK